MKRSYNKITIAMIAAMMVFGVESLQACAVCIGGFSKEKLDAYLIITILLSAVPLSLSAVVVYFYRKRAKKLDQ